MLRSSNTREEGGRRWRRRKIGGFDGDDTKTPRGRRRSLVSWLVVLVLRADGCQ